MTDHAVRWTTSGGMIDFAGFGGQAGSAHDINELGHVIGRSQATDGQFHAFRWTSSAGLTDLHDSSLGVSSSAQAISQRGQVVGVVTLPAGNYHAFVWSP